MAISGSGFYGLTLEKHLNDGFATSDKSLEAETNKIMLVTNATTPNYTTHDFRDDVTEASGTGYSSPGLDLTGTEITLSSGVLTFDATLDPSWASSTITARGSVLHAARGGAATADEIWFLHDFGGDVASVGGTFQIVWHANGLFTIDYVP